MSTAVVPPPPSASSLSPLLASATLTVKVDPVSGRVKLQLHRHARYTHGASISLVCDDTGHTILPEDSFMELDLDDSGCASVTVQSQCTTSGRSTEGSGHHLFPLLEDLANTNMSGESKKSDRGSTASDFYLVSTQETLLEAWNKLGIPNMTSQLSQKSKALVRSGIPADLRRQIWLALCTTSVDEVQRRQLLVHEYDLALEKTFPGVTDIMRLPREMWSNVRIPYFGSNLLDSLASQKPSDLRVYRLLCVLRRQYSEVHICPLLTGLLALLVSTVAESEAYYIATQLMAMAKKEPWIVWTTVKEHVSYCKLLEQLMEKKARSSLGDRFRSLKGNVGETLMFIVCTFGTTFLSHEASLRVLDVYLCEGLKAVFRIALAVLHECEPQLMKCSSPSDLVATLDHYIVPDNRVEAVFQYGFGLNMQRKEMQNMLVQGSSSELHSAQDQFATAERAFDYLYVDQQSLILPHHVLWATLATFVPERLRLKRLQRKYNSASDGFSFHTLRSRVSGPHILLLQVKHAANKHVIGAFLTHAWDNSGRYYGSGETCIFHVTSDRQVIHLPWCQDESNQFFQHMDSHGISIGGGRRGPAIVLREGLRAGQLGNSTTFVGGTLPFEGVFEVIRVEVYDFGK